MPKKLNRLTAKPSYFPLSDFCGIDPFLPNLLRLLLMFQIESGIWYNATEYSGKLYVTKPVFGRDIGGLDSVFLTHFFMVVKPFS